MLFYKTENKKINERIWTFVICKESIQKVGKELLDTATKTGLDSLKTVTKI